MSERLECLNGVSFSLIYVSWVGHRATHTIGEAQVRGRKQVIHRQGPYGGNSPLVGSVFKIERYQCPRRRFVLTGGALSQRVEYGYSYSGKQTMYKDSVDPFPAGAVYVGYEKVDTLATRLRWIDSIT